MTTLTFDSRSAPGSVMVRDTDTGELLLGIIKIGKNVPANSKIPAGSWYALPLVLGPKRLINDIRAIIPGEYQAVKKQIKDRFS